MLRTGRPLSWAPPYETHLHQVNSVLCVPFVEVHGEVSVWRSGAAVPPRIPGNHGEQLLTQVLNLRPKVGLSAS